MIDNVDWSTVPDPEPAQLIEDVRQLIQQRLFPVSGGVGQMLLGKTFRGTCRLRDGLTLDVEVVEPDQGGDEWIVLMRALPQMCIDRGRFAWKVQVGIYPEGDVLKATAGLDRAWKWAGKKVRNQLLGEIKRLATIAALVCTLREAAGELPVVQTLKDPRFLDVEAACSPDVLRALLTGVNTNPEKSS